jgi:ribosome biogenesis GTPase / thiamine phosphate phosphatase
MKARVFKSTGSWYSIVDEEKHQEYKARLRGKFKMDNLKITNPIAVGDWVEYEMEKGEENTALITNILPRKNYIIRRSAHKAAHGHMIAANIDQCVLIITLFNPKTSLGFIDRFLVSAEAFRIPAVLVFNKRDLFHTEEALSLLDDIKKIYTDQGYTCIETSTLNHEGLEDIKEILQGKTSLLSGHSGVGKSSLINSIEPGLHIKTSEISDFSNKGVHTTTFAEMFELNENTFIIDTPGIKELGLFEITKAELSHYFPEMRSLIGQCKFHNCLHYNEPGCEVIKQVENGGINPERYNGYLSILFEEETHK